MPSAVSSADELFNVAKNLLKTEIRVCQPEPLRLRLMGEIYVVTKEVRNRETVLHAMLMSHMEGRSYFTSGCFHI